jgi:hypothetical protein
LQVAVFGVLCNGGCNDTEVNSKDEDESVDSTTPLDGDDDDGETDDDDAGDDDDDDGETDDDDSGDDDDDDGETDDEDDSDDDDDDIESAFIPEYAVVSGSLLYTANEHDGLKVIDLSDATSLQVLSRQKLETKVRGVVLGTNRLFVVGADTVDETSVLAFALDDPQIPAAGGAWMQQGTFRAAHVRDNVLYVVTTNKGRDDHIATLSALSSDGKRLDLIKKVEFKHSMAADDLVALDVKASPDRLYLARNFFPEDRQRIASYHLLDVIDLSAANGPIAGAHINLMSGAFSNEWIDEHQNRLRVYELNSPFADVPPTPALSDYYIKSSSMLVLSERKVLPIDDKDRAANGILSGNRGYVFTRAANEDERSNLHVVDLPTGKPISIAGTLALDGEVTHAMVRPGEILALGRSEMWRISVAATNNPLLLASLPLGGADTRSTLFARGAFEMQLAVDTENERLHLPYLEWTGLGRRSPTWIENISLRDDSLTSESRTNTRDEIQRLFVHDSTLVGLGATSAQISTGDGSEPGVIDLVSMGVGRYGDVVGPQWTARLLKIGPNELPWLELRDTAQQEALNPLGHLDLQTLFPLPEFAQISSLRLVADKSIWDGSFLHLQIQVTTVVDNAEMLREINAIIDANDPANPVLQRR